LKGCGPLFSSIVSGERALFAKHSKSQLTITGWVGGIGFIGWERGEDENRRKRIRMRIRM